MTTGSRQSPTSIVDPQKWPWLNTTATGVRLTIDVKVNARKSIFEIKDTRLRLSIQAPAVDGKANTAIIAFIAGFFGLRKSQVKIVLGERQKHKVLELSGINFALAREKFQEILSSIVV